MMWTESPAPLGVAQIVALALVIGFFAGATAVGLLALGLARRTRRSAMRKYLEVL